MLMGSLISKLGLSWDMCTPMAQSAVAVRVPATQLHLLCLLAPSAFSTPSCTPILRALGMNNDRPFLGKLGTVELRN
jgi:hypothetical protein